MPDLEERPADVAPAAPPAGLPVYGADGRCDLSEQQQVHAVAQAAPGPGLAAWLAGLDVAALPSAVVVEVAAAWHRLSAYCHAGLLQAAGELGDRPEMRPPWSPWAGAAPGVTCVAGDELSMRLAESRPACHRLVRDGALLGTVLMATGTALASGRIDPPKAAVLSQRLAGVAHQVAHAVEDEVLPDAERCTRDQFARRVERALIEADPDGALDRHAQARSTRRVTRPRNQPDGMASMWLLLAAEDAARVDGVLARAARSAKALGDARTLDQLRADGLRDLVVGDVPLPGVPATAAEGPPEPGGVPEPAGPGGRSDAPAAATPVERDPGPPAPAAAPPPRATDPATDPARTGCPTCTGRPGAEVRVTIAASTLLGLDEDPAELDGYGPVDAVRARALAADGVWRRIVTDPRGVVLETGRTRYRPSAALAEHVRTRDATCAAPGCPASAWRVDLDHTVEFRPRPGSPPGAPVGETSAANLGPLCRRHHRLKTDGGFRLRQPEPGLFEWTTPAGHRYLVRPGAGRSRDVTTAAADVPPPF